MLRGAPISEKERKNLNLEARRLFETHGIRMYFNDYNAIRKSGGIGYTQNYLQECLDKSELINKADVIIYKQLLEIDAKLGTTQSEQLRRCLQYSPRKDLIEV